MKKLLWLDDVRDPLESDWLKLSPIEKPFEAVWVKSYEEFIRWITANGLPDGICFDYNLGKKKEVELRAKGVSKKVARRIKAQEKTGMDCAKWLIKYCTDNKLCLPKYSIQGSSDYGRENINILLKNFDRHHAL